MLCEEKDRLLEQYGILHTTKDVLEGLAEDAVIGKRISEYGAEAIVRRDRVPASFDTQPVTIEELFVIMAKEA